MPLRSFSADQNLAQVLKQCLEGGGRSHWEHFIMLAQPVIAGSVVRALSSSSSYSRELADDLIQETLLKLCVANFKALRSFRNAGEEAALRSYLKVIASNIVTSHFRSGAGVPPVELDSVPDYLKWNDNTPDRLEREALLSAVEKCLSGEDSRDRRIFWLYHRDELRPREIAAIPDIGLAMGGVENAVYKTTLRIRDCLRRAGVLDPPASSNPAGRATVAEGGRA